MASNNIVSKWVDTTSIKISAEPVTERFLQVLKYVMAVALTNDLFIYILQHWALSNVLCVYGHIVISTLNYFLLFFNSFFSTCKTYIIVQIFFYKKMDFEIFRMRSVWIIT